MTSSPRRVAHSAAWQKLSVRKTVASVSRSSEAIPHRQSLPVRLALSGSLRAGTPAMTDTPPGCAEASGHSRTADCEEEGTALFG
jgi:hypothetical protein